MARFLVSAASIVTLGVLACQKAPREQESSPRASAGPVAANVAAAPAGPTPCEISYEQTKAAIGANPIVQPGPPGEPAPKIELAPRDVYLRDCEQMPRPVQQCLVFQYAMEHRDECAQARAAYDNPRTTTP